MEPLFEELVPMTQKTLERLVEKINSGGATYNILQNKDYSGSPYIAIAPFPERSKILRGQATVKMIIEYHEANDDLFSKGFVFGGWFDPRSKKTYLDVTALVPLERKFEAITLAKVANQIAVFNLLDFSEIPIGGTGEFNDAVTPFEARLKKALTLIQE